MNRSRILLTIAVCLVAVIATAVAPVSHLPKTNTHPAVLAYVQEAAAIVKKSGPSCATFASSAWKSGDYYVFVVGPDDKLVCHPKAEMVGKPAGDVVNKAGDKVGEKIMAMGKGNGKGWVEYNWSRAGKTEEELKSTYVVGLTGPHKKHYTVGAGAWDLGK